MPASPEVERQAIAPHADARRCDESRLVREGQHRAGRTDLRSCCITSQSAATNPGSTNASLFKQQQQLAARRAQPGVDPAGEAQVLAQRDRT